MRKETAIFLVELDRLGWNRGDRHAGGRLGKEDEDVGDPVPLADDQLVVRDARFRADRLLGLGLRGERLELGDSPLEDHAALQRAEPAGRCRRSSASLGTAPSRDRCRLGFFFAMPDGDRRGRGSTGRHALGSTAAGEACDGPKNAERRESEK